MSVDQPRVIDLIGVDKTTGEVILTIFDHLYWNNKQDHPFALEDKINSYLAFVESGELLERYADAQDRPVVFKVVFKFRPDAQGSQFLARAKGIIESAGFSLRHEVFAESYDN